RGEAVAALVGAGSDGGGGRRLPDEADAARVGRGGTAAARGAQRADQAGARDAAEQRRRSAGVRLAVGRRPGGAGATVRGERGGGARGVGGATDGRSEGFTLAARGGIVEATGR